MCGKRSHISHVSHKVVVELFLIRKGSPKVTMGHISNMKDNGRTAGLSIGYKLGRRHNFCSRGPILNPRPVLDFSAQNTRGMFLVVCVKPQNELVWLALASFLLIIFI